MKLQPRSVFSATFGAPAPIPAFDVRDMRATRTPATSTRLLERADIGCVLVNSTMDPPTGVTELSAAVGLGFPLVAGAVSAQGAHRVLWLTPRSWLIQCPVDGEIALAECINEAFPDKRVHAALFTDYLCWIELSGSHALRLLTEGGFIS